MPKEISSAPVSSGARPRGNDWRYAYAMQLLNQVIQEFEAIGAREEARPFLQPLMEILAEQRARKTRCK